MERGPDNSQTMHHVTSRDGTRIAYWRCGNGPPLLLVHGATADHSTTWHYVLAALEESFTVYAMDRRGRGGSGDTPDYELLREAEDIAVVIEAIASEGGPVHVTGHSYGALCTLEASLLTGQINRMILYEGVPLNGENLYPPGTIDRLDQLHEEGDAEQMIWILFSDIIGMPPDEIELVRSRKEAWAVRVANAPTLPRELRTETGYRFMPDRFQMMKTPTLLMVGGDSPPREMQNAKAIAEALPDAHITILPGHQHAAMYTAPDLFVEELFQFLNV